MSKAQPDIESTAEEVEESDFLTRDELTEIIAYWKPILNLREWTIAQVVEVPKSEDGLTLMQVTRHHYYNDAVLHVHPWCVGELDDSPGEGDVIEEHFVSKGFFEFKVVHELLHLVLRDLVFAYDNTLEGYLHRDVHEQFDRHTKQMEERCVDNLAKTLCDHFGLFREEEDQPEEPPEYPRQGLDGTIILGPEIFTDLSEEVISWKGSNYVRQ